MAQIRRQTIFSLAVTFVALGVQPSPAQRPPAAGMLPDWTVAMVRIGHVPVPLAIGTAVVILALGSIALALTVIPKQGNLK